MDILSLEARLKSLKDHFDFDTLRNEAEQVVAQHPKEGLGYYYLGEVALNDWRFEDGIKQLEQAVKYSPGKGDYQERLAYALDRNGQADQAYEVYKNLFAQDSSRSHLLLEMANLLGNQWRNDEAMDCLCRLIELEPSNWEAYKMRARLLSNQQDHQAALDDINKVLEANPSDASALELRIWFNKGLDDIEAVEEDYYTLIELQPQNVSYYNDLGKLLLEYAEYEDAEALFSKALEIEQNLGYRMPTTYLNRAQLYLETEAYEQALADCEQALALDGSSVEGLTYKGQALQGLERYDEALEALEAALETQPFNTAPIYALRGQIYGQLGRFEEAEADLKQWTEDSYQSPESMIALGELYLAKGDLEAAYKAWAHAAQYNDEAQELIDEHCAEIQAKAEAAQEAELEAEAQRLMDEYEPYAEENGQNPILQSLFDHVWGVDLEAMGFTEEALALLPQGLGSMMKMILGSVNLEFSAQGLVMHASAMGEPMQAVYRILESPSEQSVKLFVQPLDGRESKETEVQVLEDGKIGLSGLMDMPMSEEGDAPKLLILRRLSEEELQALDSDDAQARMQEQMQNMFGGLMSMLGEEFSSAFGEDEDYEDEDEDEYEEEDEDSEPGQYFISPIYDEDGQKKPKDEDEE